MREREREQRRGSFDMPEALIEEELLPMSSFIGAARWRAGRPMNNGDDATSTACS